MIFNLETFFFDTPIYTREKIENTHQQEFNALFFSTSAQDIEGYNPWRKTHSTFSIKRTLTYSDTKLKSNGGFGTVCLQCKRYHDEFYFYMFWASEEKMIIKVGQFPTVADFHIGDVKQYKKVLSDSKIKEFTRAIGLAANGIGIGSFVYLRRIFESLIQEALDQSKSEGIVTEGDFQQARMDKKIDLLQAYLPTFLVENKEMYSILSLGIHELEEQDCLAHFDTLKVGIEIILDEKLDELRKKEKIEAAKKKLKQIKSKVKHTTTKK